MAHVQLSHQDVERLSPLMAQKGLKDFGEFLSAAINYPKGTFTEVGAPACDGHSITVNINWELWREADLLAIARRANFESVFEMVEARLKR